MERSREARRASMAATNGLSRRRQRRTSMRDSPEEDGQMELQETVRLRDRGNKKDRDRDGDRDRELLSRNKRRRGDRYVQGSNREEGEESTEDSVGDEEEEMEEDGGVARMIYPNTASSSVSAMSNQNQRKSFLAAKVGRQSPAWKVTEEMIGVPVPRKARSASAKRSSHEYWVSGGGGLGEEQNHRQPSTSPASRGGEAVSPSSSNVSIRKKMKPIGLKNRPPKVSKSSPVIQEDIEIEIAEVLYGLMKQSQSSKKHETLGNSQQKLDSKDTNGISQDTKSWVSSPQTSILPQNNISSYNPLLGVGSKRKKLEAEDNSTSVQNSSISSAMKVETEEIAKMEASSPKLEEKSGFKVGSCEAAFDMGASQATPVSLESQKEAVAVKSEDSKPLIEEDGVVTKDKPLSPKEKSSPCPKLDVDLADSTATKAMSTASAVESQREEKFEIDLMAPPPPEKDGLTDLVSDPKLMPQDSKMKTDTVVKDEEKVEKIVKKVVVVEGFGEKKVETARQKRESPKLDLEKQDQDNGSVSGSKIQQQVQSSSLPFPITVAGWPGGLPPLGYMPPLPTVVSMDASTGSSTAVQPPHSLLSQPRPKKCATHHYIARNIYYHQQFTRMNQFWPAAAGSASLYGAKPYNLNVMPSSENTILGKPLPGSFPGGKGVATFPGHIGKEKGFDVANFMDTAQRKQLVLQQAPQPVPTGNLLHGPAFIFPLSQHQPAVAATSNQSGPPKSATSTKKVSLSSNSAAVSFNYPNLPANEAPYMAILQNNGYPFPISTHVGTPPPFRGGAHSQAMPYLNGSFYSSQMFHPSQVQQQQPHSQPLFQSTHQNTSTSSGSSSSHKQPATEQQQQQRGAQVSANNFLTSTNMQLQQPHRQYVPPSHSSRKLEAEKSEDTPSVADSRPSHTQKSVYGQNFTFPVQQLNFALMPSASLSGSGGGSGNHGEKQQQQSQQQGLKGGVELIPSQAFAMSFASFNGSNTASSLNFSTMPQNPAIFQSLPDMAWHGYQVAHAAQAAQQKNYQISEGKTGGDSTNADDGRKNVLGKPPTSVGQSLAFSKPGSTDPSTSTIMGSTVFDSSARTLNFNTSPVTGNRPRAVTSTVMTTTAAAAVNSPNSQQQQLIHLQKQHHMMQQQQHAMAARSKAPTTNSHPSSSIAAKFPNNPSVFSPTFIQSNCSSQSPQWKNSARTPASQAPSASPTASTASTLKNLPQQQGRAPQGHTQISFGGNPKPATASQGQPIPINNQSPSPLVAGSPSKSASGSLKTASAGSKAGPSVPTLQSQQTENSSTGTSQKSSPVCGRNVASILSACPTQLSELKY